MRKKLLTLFVGLVLAVAVVIGATTINSAKAASPSFNVNKTYPVFVFHGIPGVPVDVYVNKKLAIPNFQPGTTVGPLTLSPGYYQVALYPVGANPATTKAIVDTPVPVSSNIDPVSIVARLDYKAAPSVQAYVEAADFNEVPGAAMIGGRDASAQRTPTNSFCYQQDGVPFKSPAVNGYEFVGSYTLYAAPAGDAWCNNPIASTRINLTEGHNVIATLVGGPEVSKLQLFTEIIPDQGDRF